jgi:hypothetical protein
MAPRPYCYPSPPRPAVLSPDRVPMGRERNTDHRSDIRAQRGGMIPCVPSQDLCGSPEPRPHRAGLVSGAAPLVGATSSIGFPDGCTRILGRFTRKYFRMIYRAFARPLPKLLEGLIGGSDAWNSRALRPGKNLGYAVALSERIHPFFDVAVSSLPFA